MKAMLNLRRFRVHFLIAFMLSCPEARKHQRKHHNAQKTLDPRTSEVNDLNEVNPNDVFLEMDQHPHVTLDTSKGGLFHQQVINRKHFSISDTKKQTVDKAASSLFKEDWKKITDDFDPESDPCRQLHCKRKEVCYQNRHTKQAECVHRRVIRLRRKLRRMGLLDEDVKVELQHTKRNQWQQPKRLVTKMSSAGESRDSVFAGKKTEHNAKIDNSVLNKKEKHECNMHALHEMGRRLLDWFKLLQDDEQARNKHRQHHNKVKRNSRKKELRDGECSCPSPVSWEFGQLDVDSDSQLSASELGEIESNLYEPCVTPFLSHCDANADLALSEHEWCCCFADILPPCLAAQRKLVSRESQSTPVKGLFMPTCDSDGFYERMQCQANIGQCWCVDRNGHEIRSTRVLGAADCSRFDGRYRGYK